LDSAQTQTLLRDGKRRQSAARSVIVASEREGQLAGGHFWMPILPPCFSLL